MKIPLATFLKAACWGRHRYRVGACGASVAAQLLFCFLGTPIAQAQPATNSQVVAQLQSRLSETQLELGRLLTAQAGSTNPIPGATTTELIEYQLVLQATARAYERQLDLLAELPAATQRQTELARKLKSWSGFDEPPPYSLLLIDNLRDSVESLTAGVSMARSTSQMFEKLRDDTRALLAQSDSRLRALNEEFETTAEPARTAALVWQRTLEQARNRLAAANAALYERRGQTFAAEAVEAKQRLELARRQLFLAGQHVRFSQADLDRVLSAQDVYRRQVESELEQAKQAAQTAHQAWESAREQLHLAIAGSVTNQASTERRGTALDQLFELRSVEDETARQRVNLARLRLDLVVYERGMWQTRFATFRAREAVTLQQGYRRLATMQRFLATAKPYFVHQLDLTARQLSEEQQGLANGPGGEPGLARQRLASFLEREAVFRGGLRTLENTERLLVRWRESLEQDRLALPLGGRVRDLFTDLSTAAGKLWNFELVTVEDTVTVDGQTLTGRRSVTVSKVAKALLILAVGYWVAHLLARFLELVAVRRLGVEPNQANLIRRWVRVSLVLVLVVVSLVWVKIPLTIFAFLGGALALGLGFGMQTMLKNFISGIIILFERPFRVGDVVDVNGQHGTVTSIGIRASILQVGDGTETLIPNSALLENSLTNWTYSNRTVRSAITVIVASDSDTRRVTQLLAEAAARHGLILKEPKAEVLFKGFEDNGFAFELRYWLDVHKHDTAQIASDLRHMIAVAFAEHNIVISFPQRDLHFDSNFPLRVQLAPVTEPQLPNPQDPHTTAHHEVEI